MDKLDGIKHDKGKLRWSLLPWGALREVVEVMEFGAREYGVRNWQRLADPETRYLDALLRHVVAHASGETRDPKTGLRHLAHAATNALFLIWFARRGGVDKTPAECLAEAEANLCEPSHLPPGARPLDVALRETREEAAVLREALRRVTRHLEFEGRNGDGIDYSAWDDYRAALSILGDGSDECADRGLASIRAAALGEPK